MNWKLDYRCPGADTRRLSFWNLDQQSTHLKRFSIKTHINAPCVLKIQHRIGIITHASDQPSSNNGNPPSSISTSPKRLAIFVSGGGSNLRYIQYEIEGGVINAKVAVVITSDPSCGAVEYAIDKNIPVLQYPPEAGQSDFTPETLTYLLKHDYMVDYVILAGYMKLVPSQLVAAYPRAMLNIHPALLPSFGGKGYYGIRVHKAVIESGARITGPTVHFVDETYDTGPILAQRAVTVDPFDTPELLAEKVLRRVSIST